MKYLRMNSERCLETLGGNYSSIMCYLQGRLNKRRENPICQMEKLNIINIYFNAKYFTNMNQYMNFILIPQ